jgi:hypothetical protein
MNVKLRGNFGIPPSSQYQMEEHLVLLLNLFVWFLTLERRFVIFWIRFFPFKGNMKKNKMLICCPYILDLKFTTLHLVFLFIGHE